MTTEIKSLRTIIEEIVTENPNSTLRHIVQNCVVCQKEFTTFGLHVDGVPYAPDTCSLCIEESEHLLMMCPNCGGRMVRYAIPGTMHEGITCPKCYDRSAGHDVRRKRALTRFEQLCPAQYRTTERDRLPIPTKYDEVLKWECDYRGLLLRGSTGTGKTRTAYALIRRLLLEGKTATVYSGVQLGNDISAYYADTMQGNGWFATLTTPDVLMIDDMGKMIFTDRVTSMLFELFERRIHQGRPIIITTDDDSSTLRDKIRDGGTAEALIRRLRECFDQVIFTT